MVYNSLAKRNAIISKIVYEKVDQKFKSTKL